MISSRDGSFVAKQGQKAKGKKLLLSTTERNGCPWNLLLLLCVLLYCISACDAPVPLVATERETTGRSVVSLLFLRS